MIRRDLPGKLKGTRGTHSQWSRRLSYESNSFLFSCSSTQCSLPVGIPFYLLIFFITFRIWLRSFTRREGLFKVCDYIVNVLCAHRYPDEIFCDAAIFLLFVAQLLVRCAPGVDCQGL